MNNKKRFLAKPLAMLMCVALMVGVMPILVSAEPSLSSINPTTTSNSATISFSVSYGTGETYTSASGRYGLTSSSANSALSVTGGPNNFTASASGLSANTTYSYYITINCMTTTGNVQKEFGPYTFTTSSSSATVTSFYVDQSSGLLSAYCATPWTQAGFVYSTSNSNPELYASTCYIIPSSSSSNSGNFSADGSSYFTSNATYYIRAYILVSGTPYYSTMQTYYGVNKPVVSTYGVSAGTNADISATGYVGSNGGSKISEYGFVYSTSYSGTNLTLDTGTKQRAGTSISEYSNFTYEWNVSSSNSSVTYYVRAFATNSSGSTGYGDTMSVTITPSSMKLTLSNLVASGTTITGDVKASGVNGSDIRDWGLVYSTSNKTPTRGGSNTSYVSATTGNNITSTTVTITGLQPNTTYYVRAYGSTRSGGSYAYSDVKTITTQEDIKLTISNVTGITFNAATATASVSSTSGSAKISERGFVYSKVNSEPTISDQVAKSAGTSMGNYSQELNLLTANTLYYIRAYARASTGEYYYSDEVKSFRTAQNYAVLNISFKTADGIEVGNQVLETTAGSLLTALSLKVPSGYKLQNENWMYSVIGNESITVYVASTGTVGPAVPTPTPGGQVKPPANVYEYPYMTGTGNYTFSPGQPATILEVATMIYNLMADPNLTYYSPYYYPDTPNDAHSRNVINFVSSMLIMSGDEKGMFRPNDFISRGEIAMIICNIKSYDENYYGVRPIPSVFPDTYEHWAKGYITLAAINGAFAGYEDGTFRPNNNVTRAEMAVILCNTFERSLEPLGSMDFVDVQRGGQWDWAYMYIMNAAVPAP